MRTSSTTKLVRFIIAPLLSLWVAGAGCMLGCEDMVAAAVMGAEQRGNTSLNSAHGLTIVASGHACSSGSSDSKLNNKSHNCCKQSSSEVKPRAARLSTDAASLIQFGASSSGMMKDCPLAGSKIAIVAKNRSSKTDTSPANAHSYVPAQSFLEETTPLSTSPRLPNRGHTYLRCCVFLI